jgi:hypothetical protein
MTNRISAPFRLMLGLTRIPVISSSSSTRNSTLSLKVWGGIPMWLPVRWQFATGSITQLMFNPTRFMSSRANAVISAVSIP